MGVTYRDAGVDRDEQDRAVSRMLAHIRTTHRSEVLADVGPFAGLFALGDAGDTVLVASADSVGTKLKLAFLLDRHDTVGADLVNHCVNDILTARAEPLFFLDYLGVGRLRADVVEANVAGLARACAAAGCALLGGETAELPGLYAPGEYDLAGFIVGRVRRDRIPRIEDVRPGDVVLGLPSTGLHTNGYSLARRVLNLDGDPDAARVALAQHVPELGTTLAEALMAEHRCYLPIVRPVFDRVKAMAHITGGGLVDNLPRALPPGVAAELDRSAWPVPPIFNLLVRRGGIAEAERYRAFNMGVGYCLVCDPAGAPAVAAGTGALSIGRIVAAPGEPRVVWA